MSAVIPHRMRLSIRKNRQLVVWCTCMAQINDQDRKPDAAVPWNFWAYDYLAVIPVTQPAGPVFRQHVAESDAQQPRGHCVMTDPTPEQPVEPEPTRVQAEPGTRLEQLHAAYPAAKSAADAAAAALKAITDGIKLELTQAAPEARRIALGGDAGPALQLTYAESWRVDAKKLKAEDPLTYVRFATKSGSWTLKAVRGGAE